MDTRVLELLLLGLCFVVIGLFVWIIKRHRTVLMGFTMFAALSFFLTNLSGFFIGKVFLLPVPSAMPEQLVVWAYTLGGLLAYALGVWQAWRPLRRGAQRINPYVVEPRLITIFAVVGAIINLFAHLLPYVPTVSPMLFKLGLLIQLAFIGAVSAAIDRSDFGRLFMAFAIFVPVGMIMVVMTGFAGMLGTFMLHPLLVFLFYKRPRWWKAGVFAVAIYAFFTMASVWFATRSIIREGGLRGLDQSERVTSFFSQFLDAMNVDMIAPETAYKSATTRIDLSMYNTLQVQHMGSGEPYSWGRSLFIDPVLALVPRALWPGKTISLGDSEFVNRYTGLTMKTENISVDTNITFELYANFSWPGVIVGLYVFGFLMGRMELKLVRPGVPLTGILVLSILLMGLASGGRRAAAMALELGTSVVGAFLLGKLLESSRSLRHKFRRRRSVRRYRRPLRGGVTPGPEVSPPDSLPAGT
jgi:hypothetical protein